MKIEIIVRTFILINNKILLCKMKGKDWFFLPGGHIKFGEKIEEGLSREIKEELGMKITSQSFIGLFENFYTENYQKHHQINLIFRIRVENINLKSKEDHIEFILRDLRSFSKENILPKELKLVLLDWIKNKKSFWNNNYGKIY